MSLDRSKQPVTVTPWDEPPGMSTGSPEPAVLKIGDSLWLAYMIHDDEMPAWEDPAVLEYLEKRGSMEPHAVVRFDGVTIHRVGQPDEETLARHPLYSLGLTWYTFHRVETEGEPLRWFVTFHDESLEVVATSATVVSRWVQAGNSMEAIERARANSPEAH